MWLQGSGNKKGRLNHIITKSGTVLSKMLTLLQVLNSVSPYYARSGVSGHPLDRHKHGPFSIDVLELIAAATQSYDKQNCLYILPSHPISDTSTARGAALPQPPLLALIRRESNALGFVV